MALFPMKEHPGEAGRKIVWGFSDAARQQEMATYEVSKEGTLHRRTPQDMKKFVGYGMYSWFEGSDAVVLNSGQWLRGEQDVCVTCLELHTSSMLLE